MENTLKGPVKKLVEDTACTACDVRGMLIHTVEHNLSSMAVFVEDTRR